ncbi:impact protein-like protein [Apiospora kogelbergensis]|uniref:Impact protein-like protein n=1 Tax=Apiospora kogelbergensis TaxID=1337665 RepID=A0AAW0QSM4_9PEZI
MASQQDLQELLRLMTVAKVPIKDAMMRVKALQTQNLRSIKDIAEATLPTIESAIPDPKAARQLHNACKARAKNPTVSAGSKRAGAELLAQTNAGANKRNRSDALAEYQDGPATLTPADFEASLTLPVETDEDIISSTTLLTNRAPLLLAFAAELLRYTMPEQPPSSRLSLAQAVVSANSRGKAVSIGIEKGPSADEEGWGHGQPRMHIMGREVTVLKRGGYEWKGEERAGEEVKTESLPSTASTASAATAAADEPHNSKGNATQTWSASSPVTSKDSTFIVRATKLEKLSQRQDRLQSLFTTIPNLRGADHNAWAYRVKKPDMFGSHVIREDSFDDGEGGSGDFMLKIMRETNTLDTLVVMTRWYGGTMLGPDRWRIIRQCLKEALSERLRATGEQASIGGEAVWGLDLEAMRSKTNATSSPAPSYSAGVVGMPIHRPESARAYLLKSFAQRVGTTEGGQEKPTPKRKTAKALEEERAENLSRLLGAIRLLYDSWASHLSADELDRRAWGWYMAARPEVDSGPAGWGAKGNLQLAQILASRRKDSQ